MKLFRELDWLAMAAKSVALELPPPMDRRVMTDGFFCWTSLVKAAKDWAFVDDMTTWFVDASRSANAQKR